MSAGNHPDSITLDEAALCLDCQVLFSIKNLSCPKCGSDAGVWMLVRITKLKEAIHEHHPESS